jgi:hypothetical protein
MPNETEHLEQLLATHAKPADARTPVEKEQAIASAEFLIQTFDEYARKLEPKLSDKLVSEPKAQPRWPGLKELPIAEFLLEADRLAGTDEATNRSLMAQKSTSLSKDARRMIDEIDPERRKVELEDALKHAEFLTATKTRS